MPVQLLLCQLCKTQRPSANVVTSGRQTLGRLGVSVHFYWIAFSSAGRKHRSAAISSCG